MYSPSCSYFFLLILGYALASPAPVPICYADDGQFPPPAASDCVRAMINIKDDPFFTTPQRFGEYEDPPRGVPIEWSYRSCLLTIDVDDGSQTDVFALSAIMPAFAAVEERCVAKRKPQQKFGGYVPIGHGRSFYAIVQYNPSFLQLALGSSLLAHSNGTNNATTSGSTDTA